MNPIVVKLLTAAAAIAASAIARKTTDGTWKVITGHDSPENPEDPEIGMKEAIAFALLSGAVMGIARMLATRETNKVLAKPSR
jgi:hypothetical protein